MFAIMRKTLALIFSLFGLFDSAYLWWVYTSPSHPLVCLGSGCDEVRASRFASWGGIPTPAFGAVMYAALVLLLVIEPFVAEKTAALLRRLAFAISAGGMVISLYLTSLEAFSIHAWCAWCVAQQIAIAIIFVLLYLEVNRPAAEAAPASRPAWVGVVVLAIAVAIAVPTFFWLSRHSAAEEKNQLEPSAESGTPDLSKLIEANSHEIGPQDAPLTIVEFGDFQCPSCIIAEATNREIRRTLPTQVRFIFREFPLAKFHIYAQKAAEAAECAGDQGKFWQMHDRMYEADGELAPVQLKYYAQDIGLDTNKFNQCLDSGAMAKRVQEDVNDGKALIVNATPTFFVNQQRHIGGLNLQEITTQAKSAAETKPAASEAPAAPEKKAPETKKAKPIAERKTEDKPQAVTTATAATSIVPGLAPASANPLAVGQAGAGDCDVNGTTGPQKNEIPTQTAQAMYKKGAVFVDIREPRDYAKSHIPGAVNLPLSKISAGASTLPKDKPVVVYESGLAQGDVCASSRAAAGLLASRGFRDVKVYHDGFAAWQKAGGAVQ